MRLKRFTPTAVSRVRLNALRITVYAIPTMGDTSETRLVSAALFGNEKFAAVVAALADEGGSATAQQIAKASRIDHSLVRNVLIRCVGAGACRMLPKVGGSRSAQYYERVPGQLWDATLALASAILQGSQSHGVLGQPTEAGLAG
jgi:hypothetical protein